MQSESNGTNEETKSVSSAMSYSTLTTQVIEQYQLAKAQEVKEITVFSAFKTTTSCSVNPVWHPFKLLSAVFCLGSNLLSKELLHSTRENAIGSL